MKRTFSTELAYVFGIVFVALGVVLMEKADFGVSMVVAPAYLLYRWLSPVWSFVTFGMAEYCLQAVLLLVMCLLLRFRVSYLFSFVTAVVYGFVLDAFMLLGAALPAGSVWLRVIYYALGMLFCAAGVSAMFHTYSKHIRCPDTRSKCAFQPCGQTAHFDFWDAPKPCLIFAKSPWIRGIARELNDIFAMTLFCDFEASQAAISTMISWIFTLCRCFLESRGGKLPLHFSELPFLQWRLTMQPLVRLWNMRSLWEHWWQRSRCLIITPSTVCALQFTGCLHCWHWCFARDFFQIRQGRKICLLT